MQYTAIIAADGDENISVAGTAKKLTLPVQFSSKGNIGGRVIIEVLDGEILFTVNGVAPTDSDGDTGHHLGIGDILIIDTTTEMKNLNMIRATSETVELYVSYEMRTL